MENASKRELMFLVDAYDNLVLYLVEWFLKQQKAFNNAAEARQMTINRFYVKRVYFHRKTHNAHVIVIRRAGHCRAVD